MSRALWGRYALAVGSFDRVVNGEGRRRETTAWATLLAGLCLLLAYLVVAVSS